MYPILRPLFVEESALHDGANVEIEIDATAFAEDPALATAGTAKVYNFPFPANTIAKGKFSRVKTPFGGAADPAFNGVTVTVGDSTSATKYAASQQVAGANASFVPRLWHTGTGNAYPAADKFVVTVTPQAGKALASLTAGTLYIYLFVEGI